MALNLDDVLAKVREERTIGDSLVALVKSLKERLDACMAGEVPPETQAKIDAIFNEVEANRAHYEEAVKANT
jgi:hypothetical protein